MLNILIDDRAVDTLFFGDDICDMDRLRANISADVFVCEGTLVGILGASSEDADGVPK
jgi:hypothetical protein